MTDDELIEAMARAMFKDDQTCRLEIAEAIFKVCKPTIEAPLRAENEKLRAMLDGRDNFIVANGLWRDFVETLLPEPTAAAAALKETGDE